MSDQHLGNVPCSHLVFIVFSSAGISDQIFSFVFVALLLKFKYKRYENKRQYIGVGIISTRTCCYLIPISSPLLAICVFVDLEALSHNL